MNSQLARHMYNVKDATQRVARCAEDRPDDYNWALSVIGAATNLAATLEALDKAKEYGG